MTEQTPAAPSAAASEPAPVITPQVDEAKDEAAIWAEIQAEKTGEKPAEAAASETQPVPAPADGAASETPPVTPAAAPTADIWANATPEQKAAYETANAEKIKYEARYRSTAGRISALQKKLNAAQAQPSREEKPAREAIAGITTDYPELAEPLKELASATDGMRDRLTKAEQASLEADTAELNDLVKAETDKLVAKHSDYADVLKQNGQAFAAWVEDQPRSIREAAYRNAQYIADGDGAITVLDGFKRHLGLIKDPARPAPAPQTQPTLDDRRQRQIEGSASPQRSGVRPTIAGIPESGDPDAIWAAIQAEKALKKQANA